MYNPTKKTYKFETNNDDVLPDITDYAVFSAPNVSHAEKSVIGWYDNKQLAGEPINFPYFGEATTLYAEWADGTGISFDDAIISKSNKNYAVNITSSSQVVYYEFVPKFTGEYRFYSKGNANTLGTLYGSNKKRITYDNDSGDGNNFYIAYNLTAGETYYIGAKYNYSDTGMFTFAIETDCVENTKTVCTTTSDGQKLFTVTPQYLPENCQIILACYEGNKLVDVQYEFNKNETVSFMVNTAFDNVKVMVMENLKTLKPLCVAEDVPLN